MILNWNKINDTLDKKKTNPLLLNVNIVNTLSIQVDT